MMYIARALLNKRIYVYEISDFDYELLRPRLLSTVALVKRVPRAQREWAFRSWKRAGATAIAASREDAVAAVRSQLEAA